MAWPTGYLGPLPRFSVFDSRVPGMRVQKQSRAALLVITVGKRRAFGAELYAICTLFILSLQLGARKILRRAYWFVKHTFLNNGGRDARLLDHAGKVSPEFSLDFRLVRFPRQQGGGTFGETYLYSEPSPAVEESCIHLLESTAMKYNACRVIQTFFSWRCQLFFA